MRKHGFPTQGNRHHTVITFSPLPSCNWQHKLFYCRGHGEKFREKECRKCRREILPLDCCCKLGVKLSSNLGVCSDLLSSANFSLRARRVVSRDTDWQEGRATRVGHLTAAALTYDKRLGLSMWGKASASAIVSWNKTFLNKAPSKTAFTFPNI